VTGPVELTAPVSGRCEEILTPEALAFLAELHERFDGRRRELLELRAQRRRRIAAGESLDFAEETRSLREDDWRVSAPPADLLDRRVEITGPTRRNMVVNALNSGARGFMADFEDSNSPTWENMIDGHVNLVDAIERRIDFTDESSGKSYALDDEVATLLVRPRGWHLPEKHLRVGGQPLAGALVDAGLYLFHGGRRALQRGSGAYFYLPKLESHLEARLWADVFAHAGEALAFPREAIATTVLIETLPAAFEMDEILYELRDHACALNAGRWDYIFSMIKTFRERPEFVLPDRDDVSMTVPHMRAYTELLVKTCHRRGAHAMGGMAAFLPSRNDPQQDEQAHEKVSADKRREAGDGFDGSWVAHPAFVAPAMAEFDAVLGERPNQVDRQRDDVEVAAADLLDARSAFEAGGAITEAGLRNDVNVAIQYISAWLRGNGAAGIYGLMEDAATAEISRSQVWQWLRHGAQLQDGRPVTHELVRRIEDEELQRIEREVGSEWFREHGRADEARGLFEQVALGEEFVEFLTLPAYEQLP
jgi:malate synthase